jgi:hypothetical protein
MKKKKSQPFNEFYRYAHDVLKIGRDEAIKLAEKAEDIFQDGFVTEETLNDEIDDAYGNGYDEGKGEGEIEGYSDCKEEVKNLLDENIETYSDGFNGDETIKVEKLIAILEDLKEKVKIL